MKFKLHAGAVAIALLLSGFAQAQDSSASTGAVAGSSDVVVADAPIPATGIAASQNISAQTDESSRYAAPDLASDNYGIFANGGGIAAQTRRFALPAGATQSAFFPQAAAPGNPPPVGLGDLGFTPEQTKGDAAEQARLDKRSHMLKIHQRLGLITIVPMIATLVAAGGAGEEHGSSSSGGRQLHAALGAVTAGMYLTTASFAIFAPKMPGAQARGPIRLHRALALIHGPGMILTPILGVIAYSQRSKGERVHGIAQAHGAVAAITAVSFGLAVLSVSIHF